MSVVQIGLKKRKSLFPKLTSDALKRLPSATACIYAHYRQKSIVVAENSIFQSKYFVFHKKYFFSVWSWPEGLTSSSFKNQYPTSHLLSPQNVLNTQNTNNSRWHLADCQNRDNILDNVTFIADHEIFKEVINYNFSAIFMNCAWKFLFNGVS